MANWAIVHRLWHNTFEEFEEFLKDLGKQLDGMAKQDGHRPRCARALWLESPSHAVGKTLCVPKICSSALDLWMALSPLCK